MMQTILQVLIYVFIYFQYLTSSGIIPVSSLFAAAVFFSQKLGVTGSK